MKIGILTAGGDSPGLNAAIRAVGKAAQRRYGMEVIGFKDGFLGLANNDYVTLADRDLAGILTRGGTILGTSRTKITKMDLGDGEMADGRTAIKAVIDEHELTALVCLGGDGTARNAILLADMGIPVLTLPKTIDNDVVGTDVTFGFDTAMGIATEAIDRLHSTAHSHHRIMVVELMGHTVGWLALGAGLAGGADVILIPEIPYDAPTVAESISAREAAGADFSIVAVAEGTYSKNDYELLKDLEQKMGEATGERAAVIKSSLKDFKAQRRTEKLASLLSGETGLESRVTILGHIQRGGTPSPADRLLATRLGTAAVDYIANGVDRVMVAARGESTEAVPLDDVAGKVKSVPLDHRWVQAARNLGISLGD